MSTADALVVRWERNFSVRLFHEITFEDMANGAFYNNALVCIVISSKREGESAESMSFQTVA